MKNNIFNNEKIPLNGEIFEILLKEKNVVIEKIISSNLIPDHEYIQDHDEWVIVIEGEAELLIENKPTPLSAGDYVLIKTGQPHKVLKTTRGTLWLAVRIY